MNLPLIRSKIPNFLHRGLFSATFCAFEHDDLNVLVLSLDKKLYLVRDKQVLSELSLQNTILKNVDLQDDVVCCNEEPMNIDDDEDSCIAKEVKDQNTDFRLEKFVLNDDIHGKVIFILIKILEKLVVLELSDSNQLEVVKQLEGVDDFVVLENPKFSYKPRIQILFNDGNSIETNFSKVEEALGNPESTDLSGDFKYILKSLENANRKLRIELQENYEETKRRLVSYVFRFSIIWV